MPRGYLTGTSDRACNLQHKQARADMLVSHVQGNEVLDRSDDGNVTACKNSNR